MGLIFFLGVLGICFAGAYFTAYIAFRRLWKDQVTHLKLAGFLATFLIAFIAISVAMTMLFNVPFGR